MKQEKIYFKCDNNKCKSEIIVEQKVGFPYKEGWLYMHEFSGKFSPLHNDSNKSFEERDKHFCSLKCQIAFIEDIFNLHLSIKENIKREEKGDFFINLKNERKN